MFGNNLLCLKCNGDSAIPIPKEHKGCPNCPGALVWSVVGKFWQCGDCLFVDSRLDPVSQKNDNVNHPKHYCSHPSGIECIQVTEHMSFLIGNAMKYLWRADEKGAPIEDLKKAIWYIEREIAKREKAK